MFVLRLVLECCRLFSDSGSAFENATRFMNGVSFSSLQLLQLNAIESKLMRSMFPV
jgi:hypothetical protein